METKNKYISQNLLLCAYLAYEEFHPIEIKDFGLKKALVYEDSTELQKAVTTFYSGGLAPAQALFQHYFRLIGVIKGNARNGGLYK